jgi:hypothetical protein
MIHGSHPVVLPGIPTITIVKKIAMLKVAAELIRVDIIPEATPLSWAGTEFIMEELLGELNIPFFQSP